MKQTMLKILLAVCFAAGCFCSHARVVTLTIGGSQLTSQVSIGTNEVAEIKSIYDSTSASYAGTANLLVQKDGRSFVLDGQKLLNMLIAFTGKTLIAGPATLTFKYDDQSHTNYVAFCTIEITPESFPPGLTVILPEGTVGTVHVESSTNLVQRQDEWVHTFANTNENRFFRVRAERTLP